MISCHAWVCHNFQMRFLLAGLLLFLTSSCSHLQPEAKWLSRFDEITEKSQKDPQASCSKLIELSMEKTALAKMAEIEALGTCPKEYWKSRLFSVGDYPDWLRSHFIDRYLKHFTVSDRPQDYVEIALSQVSYLKLQSDKIKFLEELRRTVEEAVPSEAARVQAELFQIAPRLRPETLDFVTVADDWRANREYEKAIENYKKGLRLGPLTWEQEMRILESIIKTYKLMENHIEFLKASRSLYLRSQEIFKSYPTERRQAEAFINAGLTYARSLWTRNETEAAFKVLEEIPRIAEKSRSANSRQPGLAEVYWIRGRIYEERQDFTAALNQYELGLNESPKADLADRLQWQKFWSLFKLQKWPEAFETVSRLIEEGKTEADLSRLLYWRGRVSRQLKDREFQQDFEKVLRLDPMGYYGALSLRELGKSYPHPLNTKESEKIQELPPPGSITILEYLMNKGISPLARAYLDSVTKSINLRDLNPEMTLNIMKAYAHTGYFLGLFRQLSAMPADQRRQFLIDHPTLVFPMLHLDLIKSASHELKVPAPLILGIIRQESAFDPLARSHADALGLMQLLPKNGALMATTYKLNYQDPEDLLEPKQNILLGTAFLRHLFNQSDEQFVPTVAKYNASHEAFEGWMRTRFRNDPIEFIEDIPYEETRNYVKLVLRNYFIYSILLGENSNQLFPEYCLNIRQISNN